MGPARVSASRRISPPSRTARPVTSGRRRGAVPVADRTARRPERRGPRRLGGPGRPALPPRRGGSTPGARPGGRPPAAGGGAPPPPPPPLPPPPPPPPRGGAR